MHLVLVNEVDIILFLKYNFCYACGFTLMQRLRCGILDKSCIIYIYIYIYIYIERNLY